MTGRNPLEFNPIGPFDKARLTTFFLENNIPEITATFTAFPLDETTAAAIAEQEHKDKYYALSQDGIIVGFSMLRGFDEGFIIPSFGIFIDHRFLNQGFGRILLEKTICEARNLGCERVRLSVYESNTPAHYLYESFGFKEVERASVFHHGRSDNKIIMIKELT